MGRYRTESQVAAQEALFVQQMQDAGIDHAVIADFLCLYRKYLRGDTGKIDWQQIYPPRQEDLVPYETLVVGQELTGRKNLHQLAVLKLNGGLGTSMGCSGPKSVIPVKQGRTFLDIIATSLIELNRRHGTQIPLILMNSYSTRDESRKVLEPYMAAVTAGGTVPLDFLQNRYPRIDAESGEPFRSRHGDSDSEWNPPGHGDLYRAMAMSGLVELLLARGCEYLFISNADNLGASIDLGILGCMIDNGYDFIMETTPKTRADVKGGTLIRRRHQGSDNLELLEVAQVDTEHIRDFEDTKVFKVFNTNNIWISLRALRDRVRSGQLDLALIMNSKTVEGRDVIQLETAMGSAIKSFDKTCSVVVPRSRFIPVKKTSDLLLVQSDYHVLRDGRILVNPDRMFKDVVPHVVLGDEFHTYGDFENRFEDIPSLKNIKTLKLIGNITFGKGISCAGDVTIEIPQGFSYRVPSYRFLEDVHITIDTATGREIASDIA